MTADEVNDIYFILFYPFLGFYENIFKNLLLIF